MSSPSVDSWVRAYAPNPAPAIGGEVHMSLIYTCDLNQANPFDYLTELQRHGDEHAASPEQWMPWNYRECWTDPVGTGHDG